MNAYNDSPEILACFVIDDPTLRPRYGCLNYEKLLIELKGLEYFVEIAFIPWNYRRTDPNTIRLFCENPDHLSVCVHGCDHTFSEFGGVDYNRLIKLASLAIKRMNEFSRLTGLPYDPVMVFPQGRFSSVAMRALRDVGYRAAFNSTLASTDRYHLDFSEHRLPATLAYHQFPLFKRRYPSDTKGILEDLAYGRPIIIVEHHTAFRNGYKDISGFFRWINQLGNISWRSLSDIADHYCLPHDIPKQRCEGPSLISERRMRVALRRYACEFRDNFIQRYRFLGKAYHIIRRPRQNRHAD